MLVGASSSGTVRLKDGTLRGRYLNALRTSRLLEEFLQDQEEPLGTGKDFQQGVEDRGATASIRNSLERLRVNLEDRFEASPRDELAGHRA